MSEKLPIISGKRLIKALKKMGFIERRQTGSHIILRKDNNTAVVKYTAKDIPKGTLKSILKQADISIRELLKNLIIIK